MTKAGWNNFIKNLPEVLTKTSTACFALGLMAEKSHWHCRSIFPMQMMRSYTPFQYTPYQYTPYQYSLYQYSPYQTYQSPYPSAPQYTPYTPGYAQQLQSADAVASTQSQTLGMNLITTEETQFVSDDWKTLDQKTNRTQAEHLELQGKYRDFAANFGKSFLAAIDQSSMCNKDGYITKTEFQTYYVAQNSGTGRDEAELRTEADKIFTNLDLTKEGKLDWKEITSFLAYADSQGNNQYDGKVTNPELLAAFKNVGNSNTTLQAKLKENYRNIFNTRA